MSVVRRSACCLAFALFFAIAASTTCGAKCTRFTASSDTTARVYLHSSRPVVFEMGKLGLPWRQVTDVKGPGHILTWKVKRGRTYEVWDAGDYARAQLAEATKLLGSRTNTPSDPAGSLAKTIRSLNAQGNMDVRRQVLRTRLITALSALLGARIEINAGVGNRVWPEYYLPVTSRFTCRTKGVRARFASVTLPDSWKQRARAERSGGDGEEQETLYVRLPASALRYPAQPPIIAWYDVSYRGTTFRMGNAIEAQVTDAFEREASVRTVSGTQLDLIIRLTSLLPIRGVTTEPYLPDGWTATVSPARFDVSNSRTITYRITRPADEKRGLRIAGGTFHIGDYTTSKRVLTDHGIDLGEASAVTGFKMIPVGGSRAESTTTAGRKCRRVPQSGRVFFDVSPNFLPGEVAYLTVECAGSVAGSVAVEYRSVSGEMRSAEAQPLRPDGGWHGLVFVLKNARFDGRLPNGADFALRCNGEQMPCIAGVWISRFRATAR